jgi:acyl-CoA thioesterase I
MKRLLKMIEITRRWSLVFGLMIGMVGFGTVNDARAVVRIMPLGDSITASMGGQASYRYWLWKKLATAGASVDFVGSQNGVGSGTPRFTDFDQNHEGHTGWTTSQVTPNVTKWARASRPDLVLLDLGANDIVQGRPSQNIIMQLRTIVVLLRAVNPNVKVLLAKLTPMSGFESQVAELNAQIGPLAMQLNRPRSQVMVVDLASGFDLSADVGDGVHPTEAGEKLIANRFYRLILPMLVLLHQPAKHPALSVQF